MAPRKQRPQPSPYVAKPDPEGVWNGAHIKLGSFRVVLTPTHVMNPGNWSVSCSPFFDLKTIAPAASMTEEQARVAALTMIKDELDKALKAVDEAIG